MPNYSLDPKNDGRIKNYAAVCLQHRWESLKPDLAILTSLDRLPFSKLPGNLQPSHTPFSLPARPSTQSNPHSRPASGSVQPDCIRNASDHSPDPITAFHLESTPDTILCSRKRSGRHLGDNFYLPSLIAA